MRAVNAPVRRHPSRQRRRSASLVIGLSQEVRLFELDRKPKDTQARFMKRFSSVFVICLGVAVMLAGFIYDVEYAGIPPQDPTPEMWASYTHQAGIASNIRWLGFGLFLYGIISGLVRLALRRFRRK